MNTSVFCPRKILIINIFGIGDVLFTMPLVVNLKQHWPSVSIGYLCNVRTAPLLSRAPQIDKIFVYERDEFQQIYHRSKRLYLNKIWRFWQAISKEKYDMVIDLSLNSFMSLGSWLSRIPQRIGFNYKNRSPFLNIKIPLQGYEDRHVIEYYLKVLDYLGIPPKTKAFRLQFTQEDLQLRDDFIKNNNIQKDRPLIGLVPGGGASWGKEAHFKRWPVERYAKLADKLFEKFAVEVILMGGSEDKEVCQRAADLMTIKPLTVCGKTSILQFGALAALCDVVILNDGGSLHVAAASGAKTVSIFGPVDERVYGPYSGFDSQRFNKVVKKDLACRPCYRQFRRAQCDHVSCLNLISVEDVLKSVEEILAS